MFCGVARKVRWTGQWATPLDEVMMNRKCGHNGPYGAGRVVVTLTADPIAKYLEQPWHDRRVPGEKLPHLASWLRRTGMAGCLSAVSAVSVCCSVIWPISCILAWYES